MANSSMKPSLTARTLQFGSNCVAGAMMLSRMNRSEISRYDDLVSDLCRLRAPAPGTGPSPKGQPHERRPLRGRWTWWAIGSPKS